MRCKACDAQMTELEIQKKDKKGQFLDLCGACYRVSEDVRMDLTGEDAEGPIVAHEPRRRPLVDVFDEFVLRKGLWDEWKSGLGLKWGPDERARRMYVSRLSKAEELHRGGFSINRSVEQACGYVRGNLSMAQEGVRSDS